MLPVPSQCTRTVPVTIAGAWAAAEGLPPAADVAIVPAWAPVALTARGTAYLRLAEFRDIWAGLGPEDRAYFADELRALLVEAVVPGVEPGR